MGQLVKAVAETSQAVGATTSRLAKARAIADLLVATPPDELAIVVSWLCGDLPQRQIGVGWASLRSLPEPAHEPTLTVGTVHRRFSEIKALSGPGSQAVRAAAVDTLFGAATSDEQRFLVRLLGGELRQGALAGVVTDAVARAATVPVDVVRRAAMLSGDLGKVAQVALSDGTPGLEQIGLQVGRAVSPMLASTATSVADAIGKVGGPTLFEAKLDGARIQVHRCGDDVHIYTRSLDEITHRLPEVVDVVRRCNASEFVLDGEAIGLTPDGLPIPFQDTASRFGRKTSLDGDRAQIALTPFFFDVLHLDGADLFDEPTVRRFELLDSLVPSANRVDRLLTDDPDAAEAFLRRTLDAGHEGVLAKSPEAPYEAGRRGALWLKVKPVHTLDLVVLAVEWGSGRRTGTLSNIHLGAREPVNGGFVMLGKTFKGMTDEMLAWQTARFTELAEGPTDGWVVRLKPEQVVEIAFDGVQRSTRYPGGVALRFARVLRYRHDKTVAEIDTIETVRSFLR